MFVPGSLVGQRAFRRPPAACMANGGPYKRARQNRSLRLWFLLSQDTIRRQRAKAERSPARAAPRDVALPVRLLARCMCRARAKAEACFGLMSVSEYTYDFCAKARVRSKAWVQLSRHGGM